MEPAGRRGPRRLAADGPPAEDRRPRRPVRPERPPIRTPRIRCRSRRGDRNPIPLRPLPLPEHGAARPGGRSALMEGSRDRPPRHGGRRIRAAADPSSRRTAARRKPRRCGRPWQSAAPAAELRESTEAAPDEPPPAPESRRRRRPGLSVVEVRDLDWEAVRAAVADPDLRGARGGIIARMEERLAGGGPLGLAFEEYAAGPGDLAIRVGEDWPVGEVWFVGDLHGDLLALETALQHIDRSGGGADARIVFLGDLFDDGAHAAEVVLRVFELVLDGPMRVTVSPATTTRRCVHRGRALPVHRAPLRLHRLAERRPRPPLGGAAGAADRPLLRAGAAGALLPGRAAGGARRHPAHRPAPRPGRVGDWNDPRVLQDFVWLRAHPRARKRIPNRTTRGSEFGREDFAAFCEVAARPGRPVSRMLRGHDHVEERFAVYPGWERTPRSPSTPCRTGCRARCSAPYERVPVIARWVRGKLPEVRRLFIPPELLREVYPEPARGRGGSGRVKRVIERCPICGAEHDDPKGGACEACGADARLLVPRAQPGDRLAGSRVARPAPPRPPPRAPPPRPAPPPPPRAPPPAPEPPRPRRRPPVAARRRSAGGADGGSAPAPRPAARGREAARRSCLFVPEPEGPVLRDEVARHLPGIAAGGASSPGGCSRASSRSSARRSSGGCSAGCWGWVTGCSPRGRTWAAASRSTPWTRRCSGWASSG